MSNKISKSDQPHVPVLTDMIAKMGTPIPPTPPAKDESEATAQDRELVSMAQELEVLLAYKHTDAAMILIRSHVASRVEAALKVALVDKTGSDVARDLNQFALREELAQSRKTCQELNRRAQSAEGLVAKFKLVEGRPQGPENRSFGRALANYAAAQFTRERDALKAANVQLREELRLSNEVKEHLLKETNLLQKWDKVKAETTNATLAQRVEELEATTAEHKFPWLPSHDVDTNEARIKRGLAPLPVASLEYQVESLTVQLAEARTRLLAVEGQQSELLDAINAFGGDGDRLDGCLLRLLKGEDCRGEANGLINIHAISFSDRRRLLKKYGRSVDPAKGYNFDAARLAKGGGVA